MPESTPWNEAEYARREAAMAHDMGVLFHQIQQFKGSWAYRGSRPVTAALRRLGLAGTTPALPDGDEGVSEGPPSPPPEEDWRARWHHREQELGGHKRQLEAELEFLQGTAAYRLWRWGWGVLEALVLRPWRAGVHGLRVARYRTRDAAKLQLRRLGRGLLLTVGWGVRTLLWPWQAAGAAVRELGALSRRRKPVPRLDLQDDGTGLEDAVPALPFRPRVLIVMPYSIFPPNHGGAVRLWNLVRHLGKEVDLHLLVFSRPGEDDSEQREALEPHCASVRFHPWRPDFHRPLWRLGPPNALLFESQRLAATLRDVVETEGIDVVQLEYTELAQYIDLAAPARVVLVEHDVAFRSFWRRRRLGFGKRFPGAKAYGASFGDWLRLQRYEIDACRRVDQIHTMSSEDGAYLARYLGDGDRRMWVVPNAVDVEYYRPSAGTGEGAIEERRGVVFVGNYENLPNLDALEYFLAEIWPRVRSARGDAELSLVGAKMPDRLRELDGRDGVRVVGRVEDMRPSYHRPRVLVVPLRAGSGTRLKLFEAFAAGIPVVSTALGAEGIDCRHEVHLLVADDPEAFADGVVRLLEDSTLGSRLATAALDLVTERYDWSVAAVRNLAGYRELLAPPGEKPLEPRLPKLDRMLPEWRRERDAARAAGPVDVSVVLPTYNGGALLARTLELVGRQETPRSFEILCIDSGSRTEDLEVMSRAGARVHGIDRRHFDHGLTRDLGAELARGRVVVFLNQDAMPVDASWLDRLTDPLFADDGPAAVQGGILELPPGNDLVRRFFWDSCGERFYFTRESQGWIERFDGVGFSTVNAALRRDVWERIPFGRAPIMEDKKWQREAMERGLQIVTVAEAAVHHTHDYDWRSLKRRCKSEGFGWRLLDEPYTFGDMVRDMAQWKVWREALRGFVRGEARRPAELAFPWLRPLMLWVGNRWSRGVEL